MPNLAELTNSVCAKSIRAQNVCTVNTLSGLTRTANTRNGKSGMHETQQKTKLWIEIHQG